VAVDLHQQQLGEIFSRTQAHGVGWKGTAQKIAGVGGDEEDGYYYIPKRYAGLRLRLARTMNSIRHHHAYRIHATFTQKKRDGLFLENVGFWDSDRKMDDPLAFRLRCDRICFWLRRGAAPSDAVANLLDIAGLIRRTGPRTESIKHHPAHWEWRIDPNSGPEAPEGWSWDGPQEVSWNNRPRVQYPKKPSKDKNKHRPLMEKFGFVGYQRVPLEYDTMPSNLIKANDKAKPDGIYLPSDAAPKEEDLEEYERKVLLGEINPAAYPPDGRMDEYIDKRVDPLYFRKRGQDIRDKK
jgi:ribosomal protein S16